MNIDLKGMLASHVNDPRMGAVAFEALRIIGQFPATSEHVSTQRIPPKQVAEIWKRRLSMGFLKKEAICGIEETISSLSKLRSDVLFGYVETPSGFVGVWFLDEQSGPVGIIAGDSTKVSCVSE